MTVSDADIGRRLFSLRSYFVLTSFAIIAISNFGVSLFRELSVHVQKSGNADNECGIGPIRGRIKGFIDYRVCHVASLLVRMIDLSRFNPQRPVCMAGSIAVIFLAATAAIAQSNLLRTVHFGDRIEIDVLGSFEYDWRGGINPEGFLDGFDRVEEQVYVLCKTEAEVAAEVARLYSRFLREPVVTVRIIDTSGRPNVFLTGGVRNPQRFRLMRAANLQELLIMSGGLTEFASGEITLFRRADTSCDAGAIAAGSRQTLRIKISDILAGDPAANPLILTGDIVDVNEAFPIYVIGGIARPGRQLFRTELTLSRAVAAAGGLDKNGVASRVIIFRRDGGASSVIEADLEKIAIDPTNDIELKPYDIVDIGIRGREQRQFPPVVEGSGAASVPREELPLRVVD